MGLSHDPDGARNSPRLTVSLGHAGFWLRSFQQLILRIQVKLFLPALQSKLAQAHYRVGVDRHQSKTSVQCTPLQNVPTTL
jgi:hypothetical protein